MLKLPVAVPVAVPDGADSDADESNDAVVDLIKRVSERVAMGVPLRLAAVAEGLSPEEYEDHLRERPELAALQHESGAAFVEDCVRKLLKVPDPSSNIRWLLERLYPDMFRQREREREPEAPVKRKQTIAGVPEEDLEAARAYALAHEC